MDEHVNKYQLEAACRKLNWSPNAALVLKDPEQTEAGFTGLLRSEIPGRAVGAGWSQEQIEALQSALPLPLSSTPRWVKPVVLLFSLASLVCLVVAYYKGIHTPKIPDIAWDGCYPVYGGPNDPQVHYSTMITWATCAAALATAAGTLGDFNASKRFAPIWASLGGAAAVWTSYGDLGGIVALLFWFVVFGFLAVPFLIVGLALSSARAPRRGFFAGCQTDWLQVVWRLALAMLILTPPLMVTMPAAFGITHYDYGTVLILCG